MRFFSTLFSVLILNFSVLAQNSDKKNIGHINDNPFRQLTDYLQHLTNIIMHRELQELIIINKKLIIQ